MGNYRGCPSLHLAMRVPYTEKESRILGKVLRPLIQIEVFSVMKQDWEIIDDVLVDTGADLTVLPRYLGESIIRDIATGEYVEIKGVVPTSVLIAFIHCLKLKVAGIEFETKIAIADSNDVPPILGRCTALDLFTIEFIENLEKP